MPARASRDRKPPEKQAPGPALLAKSNDARLTDFERSVAGHSVRVGMAAQGLLRGIGDDLARTFGLSPEGRALLDKITVLAALLHDIGKTGRSFQAMLRDGSTDRHPYFHEHLSAALICGDGPLRDWLLQGLDRHALALAAMAAAGHHLRAGKGFESARTPRDETLHLDHEELTPLWQAVAAHVGLAASPGFPRLSLDREDIEDTLFDLIDESDDLLADLPAERAPVLPLAKALVICADIVGSGKPEAKPEATAKANAGGEVTMHDWLAEVLDIRLTPAKLQPVIDQRLGGKKPFGFQERVAASRDRVTLVTAGCGNGKTLAAYRWAQHHAAGRKLVFCYPTTGTTTAGFADYLLAQSELERALLHSRASADIESFQDTPGEPGDEKEPLDPLSIWAPDAIEHWSKEVIACTVDAALGLLTHWRKALAMLPVWAQSAFVFDEIHSYDRELFGALLAFLELTRAPVLLMTASLTRARRQALERVLGHALVPITGEPKIEDAPRYELHTATADEARARVRTALAEGARVLWVSNTVGRAMSAFDQLGGALEGSATGARAWLYHSRFRYHDRVTRQGEVIKAFHGNQPALVVATQVCEMSLDISADLLITELAPFPALVQRLGRLNRRDKEPKKTRPCLVIEPEGARPHAPYEAAELDRARRQLAGLTNGPLGQSDLARAIEAIDEADYQRRDVAFTGQRAHTFPEPLRELSHAVTVVRAEDLNALPRKRWSRRAELTRIEIPMIIGNAQRAAFRTWDRVKGIPIAPKGSIDYSLERGATWAK